MQRKTYIVAKLFEIQVLVAAWLGNPAYDTLLFDLRENDWEGASEGIHEYTIAPESEWSNHDLHIGEVRDKGKVEWGWELLAVMEELARDGKIEFGDYIIEIYDGEMNDENKDGDR